MMRRLRSGWRQIACLLPLLVSACLPAPTPAATPTATASATITPTVTTTVVWFPATATNTPLPTRAIEPTVDARPALGEVLFREPFTNKTLWQTSRTAAGSVAYGKEELTLAVAEPRVSLLSLRKSPQLYNFYLEVDAQPSLCRGEDSFGLLLRASSSQDYYRLLLACDGKVRMDRIINGRSTPLQDWLTSGQLLPGGMFSTRIGVSAQGQELSVFINGEFAFAVKDPVHESGVVGVFARSAGDTPLTVNFSNMVVYEIAAGQQPSRTPAPTSTP